MIKHVRNDLNLAHLVARSGIYKPFDIDFLTQANKNNWLPVHLSKNKYIAQILLSQSKETISLKDLIIPGLKNYAQSTQTKYGVDLEQFLIEKGFSPNEASLAKVPPSDIERLDLGSYYFSLLEPSWYKNFDFNPIDLAVSHCNSHFFFALKNSQLFDFVDFFKPSSHITIGCDYFIKDKAFQIKQQFKQFWNIDLSISINPTIIDNSINKPSIIISHNNSVDYLKNLEGA